MPTLSSPPPDPLAPVPATMTGTVPMEPFIAPETVMHEFTWRAVIVGTFLGMVFGASSLYLTLKVGLTVSASIPVAVISLTLFRGMARLFGGARDATILEHNITQTAGSAGESIAFGVGVTMPAILILGFDLELTRVAMVAILGGLLGILMMIPLRRALIVKEHGILKYPEGTACAAVLKAGASPEDRAAASPSAKEEIRQAQAAGLGESPGAQVIFAGFGIGLLYKTAESAFRLWKEIPERIFGPPLKAGSVGVEISPELLGVGYIIGPRIGSIMCAGGVLAYLVLIPMIKFFGEKINGPLAPGTIPIADMEPDQIRSAYVLYIGAGAVAAGGLISLATSLPTIWHGMVAGLRNVRSSRAELAAMARAGTAGTSPLPVARTDRDLPLTFVGIGMVVLLTAIIAVPSLQMNILGALLIIVFGFLFVTVSSRLTGEIGSSSNPISGMTVATLLFTCLVFLVIGWTGPKYYVLALSVGAIVCIAASNGGTTSQDLKTGYLLGATPRHQQTAILFGAFASALILGPILLVLNNSRTVYVPAAQVAPAGLTTSAAVLRTHERLHGPQASSDPKEYLSWQKTDDAGGPAGKYLVDETGKAVWLVDPGINGQYKQRGGETVEKFNAPKAVLVSYIIKGILNQNLPWALVLLGVMIAVVLELSGIPSLAFAVGVYLPLSSSSPIFVGGMIRWLVDARQRAHWKSRGVTMSEEEMVAETDKSPGVLLSSGYIAGGAIAGIIVAIVQGAPGLEKFNENINKFAEHNPMSGGALADLWSLLPYLAMCVFLFLIGRGRLLAARKEAVSV